MNLIQETLWRAAVEVRENAYAPYSRYQVGAALRLRDQDVIVCGCNVENASYGATLCAERNAVFQAVARFGPSIRIEELVLVTESTASPCGMCLQVLSEFCDGETPIHLATPAGIQQSHTLNDFLPLRFDKQNLSSAHD